MDKKKEQAEAGFITKASAHYCDLFPLRAAIQSIPGLGGTLDTMLAGLGAKYQYVRLEHFTGELDIRLKRIESLPTIEPGEPLWDFMMQVFDKVIRSRSEEKRKRFANLVANQVTKQSHWEEAETATRLLGELTDIHIKVLDAALKVTPCEHPSAWSGRRVLTLADKQKLSQRKEKGKVPTNISDDLPQLSLSATEMICSELMARGLLRDVGVGSWGGGTFMGYFEATESAKWFMDWISESPEKHG